ncbi:uncharacterized protein J4E79_004786 [Alternaria viburni]|uniref:uncharacterized protein n=1 Tax=Alternaria viburni TaxID=566460 RepID=UPI0020C34DBB|nr:uncharacterized protein J4E79_004786 [Alternaria viburni]KAI4662496.1 hypothetical protein J4E79_004786 [Alternaria viburni]
MSLPSRWPSSYPTCSTFTPNPYHSTPKQRPKVKKHRYQTHGYGYQARGHQSHGRTGSWEKLKVKAVTSIGSDLKRSISTGVAPVITEGKDSVKNLVGKVERAGGSMTRKFSASLKDKLKAFGKKKEGMSVEGTYAVQALYTKLRTFSTHHVHPSLSSHPVSAIYPWPLDAILLPKRKPNETPLDKIYVMYHYLIRGDYEVLRNEVQDFFDHTNWHVHSIPDPRDHDPERYAILAAITQYLAHGINRRIKISHGCRKEPLGPWKTAAYDACYNGRGGLPIFEKLEREPKWAGRVKRRERV